MRRFSLPILALAAVLGTAACQNPDGSTNWGNTLLLGGAAGLGTAAVIGAINDDNDNRRDRRRYQYQRQRYSYDQGYRRGYQRGYYQPRGYYEPRYYRY
jgi:hypothetical protein